MFINVVLRQEHFGFRTTLMKGFDPLQMLTSVCVCVYIYVYIYIELLNLLKKKEGRLIELLIFF